MNISTKNRFIFLHIGIPLLLAILVFLLFDMTEIDLTISNLLYDENTKSFFWLNNKWVESILHKDARNIPGAVAVAATIGALLSFSIPAYRHFFPNRKLPYLLEKSRKHQIDFFYIWISMAVATGLFMHSLKTETGVYCPVETVLYGGKMLYFKWWSLAQQPSEDGGRCWPGGHAAGAFSLFALYFVALRHRWRHTIPIFYSVAALGLFFGTVRVLQGWHFMSHTLWSGLYMWTASLIVALLFYGDGNKKYRVIYTLIVFTVLFGSVYINKFSIFNYFTNTEEKLNVWIQVSHFIWTGNYLWLSLLALLLICSSKLSHFQYAAQDIDMLSIIHKRRDLQADDIPREQP